MKRLIILAALPIMGCASVMGVPDTQDVTVKTSPAGAKCVLSSDRGTWYVQDTPQTITIMRPTGGWAGNMDSKTHLRVNCYKGALSGNDTYKGYPSGWGWGNIATGFIGSEVDKGNGLAFSSEITIELK